MNLKHTRLGFTLAELLAVVIIVAILAALATGYYKRSVEQSRFAEGLAAASAIAEGVNRSYEEQRMEGIASPTKRPKISSLDISVRSKACQTVSDYCIKAGNFEIVVNAEGVTTAYQGTTTNYKYSIEVQPHFASSNRDRIACVGAGGGTQAIGNPYGFFFQSYKII